MFSECSCLYEYIKKSKSEIKNDKIERLSIIIKKILNEDQINEFIRISMNNPHRISIWAETITEEEHLINKIEDWKKRGIWHEFYATFM